MKILCLFHPPVQLHTGFVFCGDEKVKQVFQLFLFLPRNGLTVIYSVADDGSEQLKPAVEAVAELQTLTLILSSR